MKNQSIQEETGKKVKDKKQDFGENLEGVWYKGSL